MLDAQVLVLVIVATAAFWVHHANILALLTMHHKASGRHDEVAFISSQDTVATRTRSQTLAANATDSKNKVSCCFL